MSPKQLVWLITGTSTGIGRELALEGLNRGEKVIATARNVSKIDDLKQAGADILRLDVTESLENLHGTIKQAVEIHGRIDVLVNNAGYIEVGALEESTPEESFQQFNTNIFGALNVTRAVLPYMRAQKSGTIVWFGSIGGWRGSPNCGLYIATKFATRGLAESLQLEVGHLGLRNLCFEPGYFRTSFLADGHRQPYNPRISDYNEITQRAHNALEAYNGKQPGDPKKLASVVLDVVRKEGVAEGRDIPVSLPLGSDCFEGVRSTLEKTTKVLNEWEDVIKGTDFPKDN
ncbi:hypothetical protein Clacol_009330 [Clathrus columnatus]|uniref:NAD(P)-binding protein n=1 Tax=Clathrus columnatus TaxID=1419009 RepID=A0AAV5AT20_9AGAM|nr:hypothetical protein Clacol_009330 [Clathrus columnatus]